MAGLHKNRMNTGDCLVLNTDGRIAEAISSNLFLVRGGTVYTPSLQEACVSGIMRQVILEFLRKENISYSEKGISIDDLQKAEEVFLTDVIHGIRWVGAFRAKRYFNSFSRQLLARISEMQQIKKV